MVRVEQETSNLLRDILDGKTTPALRELAAYRD
jgi:hypothetical protein